MPAYRFYQALRWDGRRYIQRPIAMHFAFYRDSKVAIRDIRPSTFVAKTLRNYCHYFVIDGSY
jgi:hypothetical protein